MDLEALVEMTLHAVILECDPQDQDSYEKYDSELQRVELLLRRAAPDIDPSLLPAICSERVQIAFEARKYDAVLEQSDGFLREFPATTSSFPLIASLRVDALHLVEAHEEEVREAIDIARKPEVRGSEYIYLLANLSRRHPGVVPADEHLWQKLRESISDLRGQGYDSLPHADADSKQLEETVRCAADALRRANRERGQALLNGQT